MNFLLQTAKNGLKFFYIALRFRYVLHFLPLQQKSKCSCVAIHFEEYLWLYFRLLMLFNALSGSSFGTDSYTQCLWHNHKERSQEEYGQGSELANSRDLLVQSINLAFFNSISLTLPDHSVTGHHLAEKYFLRQFQ